MDVSALRGRIIATLDSDQSIRMQAELDLKTVSNHHVLRHLLMLWRYHKLWQPWKF